MTLLIFPRSQYSKQKPRTKQRIPATGRLMNVNFRKNFRLSEIGEGSKRPPMSGVPIKRADGDRRSSHRMMLMRLRGGLGSGMAGEDFDVRTATPGSARVAIRISAARCVALHEREMKRSVRWGLAVFG